jgi:hypothetical protein
MLARRFVVPMTYEEIGANKLLSSCQSVTSKNTNMLDVFRLSN